MASTSSAFEVPRLPGNSQDSSESDNDEQLEPPEAKKKRSKNLKYTCAKSFQTMLDYNLWWEAEQKKWWFKDRYEGTDETSETWYCRFNGKKSGRTGVNCQARLRIYFCHYSETVRVMVCDKEHEHTVEKEVGLPDNLKANIKACLAHGMTSKKIHIKLTNEQFVPLPTLKQIQQFVDRQRAAASKPFTDTQMRKYCEENSDARDDENHPYVLASNVESTEKFHVIWTTPRLLQRQLQSDQLQVDATYKTNWHEYPVIIIGHSNLDHHFQPTMLAVGISEDQFAYGAVFNSLRGFGYEPREVLGDGSGAITAATKTHFPQALRVMCFAHVIRRFDKHSVGLPDDVRVRLRSDFCMLQYSRNPIEYSRMATSMLDGWKGIGDSAVDKFAEYVRKTYLDSELFAFFEGVSENCVNNNGLESINLSLKRDHTFRKLLSLPVFFEKVAEFLNYWSNIVTKPTIPLKVFKSAYKLQQQCAGAELPKRYYIKINGTAHPTFAFSPWNEDKKELVHQSDAELFAAYHKLFVEGPVDFKEYKKERFKAFVVSVASSGKYYVCTCPEGSKKEPCKHATMVMCALTDLYEYPADVTAQPMKTNRKSKEKGGRRPLADSQHRHAAAD